MLGVARLLPLREKVREAGMRGRETCPAAFSRLRISIERPLIRLRPPSPAGGEGDHRIRVWREQSGLTISQLAAMSGLSQPYVSQIESGGRKGGSKALAALARVLGVEAGDLVG